MRLWFRLRMDIALFICPELGVEARLKAARKSGAFDVSKIGFFDEVEAQRHAAMRRNWNAAEKALLATHRATDAPQQRRGECL